MQNLLRDPQNPDAFAKAQSFTEQFSADRESLDGIYIGEWNTHVLAHTNLAVVGITTREGEKLTEIQNQSDSNKELVEQLEGIIHFFKS